MSSKSSTSSIPCSPSPSPPQRPQPAQAAAKRSITAVGTVLYRVLDCNTRTMDSRDARGLLSLAAAETRVLRGSSLDSLDSPLGNSGRFVSPLKWAWLRTDGHPLEFTTIW